MILRRVRGVSRALPLGADSGPPVSSGGPVDGPAGELRLGAEAGCAGGGLWLGRSAWSDVVTHSPCCKHSTDGCCRKIFGSLSLPGGSGAAGAGATEPRSPACFSTAATAQTVEVLLSSELADALRQPWARRCTQSAHCPSPPAPALRGTKPPHCRHRPPPSAAYFFSGCCCCSAGAGSARAAGRLPASHDQPGPRHPGAHDATHPPPPPLPASGMRRNQQLWSARRS